MADKTKIVNDIVHGLIDLPPHIVAIIDTEQFQRLRSISQLGFARHVYPSASYSRFEHCIGTFHLASDLIKKLQQQIKDEKLNINLSEEEIKCVEIAALCHDLGHGPYSHLWEHAVIENIENRPGHNHQSHEELSCKILSNLINTTNLKAMISLETEDVEKIERMILGNYDKQKDGNKRFLFEITANKYSGLDVDKFDYLCRDLIYLGWSNKNKIQDIKRIIHFIRVVEYDGEWRLAMRDREIFHIYDIFYSRHMLHRYGYQHKTAKALDCMFRNAMRRIMKEHFDELIVRVIGRRAEICLCSEDFISKCCDFDVWKMMSIHTPDIIRNINERKLYKLYCKLQILTKEENTQFDYGKLNDGICKLETRINENLPTSGNPYNFVTLTLSKFSLRSEKQGDPILLIPFYAKDTPNECFIFNKSNRPPALVNLIDDDYNLLIFTEESVIPETDIGKELHDHKNNLLEKESSSNPIEEIKELVNKYKFIELKY